MTELAVSLIPRYCGPPGGRRSARAVHQHPHVWCDTVAIPEPSSMAEIGLGRMSLERSTGT
jgi:hypothetical protein